MSSLYSPSVYHWYWSSDSTIMDQWNPRHLLLPIYTLYIWTLLTSWSTWFCPSSYSLCLDHHPSWSYICNHIPSHSSTNRYPESNSLYSLVSLSLYKQEYLWYWHSSEHTSLITLWISIYSSTILVWYLNLHLNLYQTLHI